MPVVFSIGTITKVAKDPGRAMFPIQTTCGLPESYATGGVDIATALAALAKAPNYTIIDVKAEPVAGYYFEWVRSTGKLKAIVAGTGAECANGVDLKAFTAVQLTIWVY